VKVALVTADFYPHVGGQESRFLAIGTEMAARGFDVDVLCLGHRPELPPVEFLQGVRIERFPITRLHWDRPPPRGFRNLSRIARVVLLHSRYMVGVHRRLKSRPYDFVYLNQYPLVHVLAIPRAVRSRSGIDWCELRTDFPHPLAQRSLPATVAINMCVQADLASQLAEQSGVNVGYLPSGAFTGNYLSLPAVRRSGWLFLGRWFPNKRIPLLIASWVRYRESGGNDPLVIAGDGPDRARVRSSVEAVPDGLRSEIALPGHVDEAAKVELLATSRVLLLTSDREGFPNVLVEAMASGLPVITVDEPLNGAAGVVRSLGIGEVTAPDPARISDAALAVEADWERYSASSSNAAARFDWSGIVQELIDAFSLNSARGFQPETTDL
jgi:glycosyltransferase involved in cell wall biosynthesis